MECECSIHPKASWKKGTPLLWDYGPTFKVRLRRWRPFYGYNKPNAHAVENLPAGGVAVLDIEGGIAEVRAKK